MFQNSRDFLVQEIQEFFQALSWIIHARSEGRSVEAYAFISQLFADRLRNELRNVSDLSPLEVVDLCHHNGSFSAEMATAMAPLLMQKAELEMDEGDFGVSSTSLKQARALYQTAVDLPGEAVLVDIEERIKQIDDKLEQSKGNH